MVANAPVPLLAPTHVRLTQLEILELLCQAAQPHLPQQLIQLLPIVIPLREEQTRASASGQRYGDSRGLGTRVKTDRTRLQKWAYREVPQILLGSIKVDLHAPQIEIRPLYGHRLASTDVLQRQAISGCQACSGTPAVCCPCAPVLVNR